MLKWVLASAGSAAVISLVAGGTLDSGRIYHLSLPEARARLASLPAPEAASAFAGGTVPGITRSAGEREVRWTITGYDGGSTLYLAELTPYGQDQTKVRLSIRRQGSGLGVPITNTRFMQGFDHAAFEAAVDGVLEDNPGRRLDPVRDWAVEAANDPEQMREVGEAVSGMFNEVQKTLIEESRHAPRDRDLEYRMEAATRPMVDLRPSDQNQEWNR